MASGATEYYEHYWSKQGFNPAQALDPEVRKILEGVVRPADSCLDVGCGAGAGPGAWLSQHAGSYIGVDISARAVEAMTTAGLAARRIEDASGLPFDDATFDTAACLEVFEHLFEPQLAAAEILRVLRPGGKLIATVPNVAHWRRRADIAILGRWNPLGDSQSAHRPWRDPHLRFFGVSNLRQMLSEAGFDQIAIGGHGAPWLADVPGLRRLMRSREPGPLYGRLVRIAPSVFAHNLHAVAARPRG